MGKFQDLFRNVSLGTAACATEADCHKCPYHAYPEKQCEIQLESDKLTMVRLMAYLDKIDDEVDEI